MARRKELDELREIARIATDDALQAFEPPPQAWRAHLALGTRIDADHVVFELYVAAERPEHAIVISTARVHRTTRAVEVTIAHLTKIG